jgi:hypothetical protein
MKKWIYILISTALLVSAQCAARQKYAEKQAKEWDKQVKACQDAIEKRKMHERKHAQQIENNLKLHKSKATLKRARTEQEAADQKAREEEMQAHRNDVHHFAQLTQELALPFYNGRPILDIIHEAEFTLEKIALHNPRELPRYQAELERALKQGKHPISPDGSQLYPNAELIARQSMQTLIDYTHTAQQMVEETASRAQETAHSVEETAARAQQLTQDMSRTFNENHRAFAALKTQINNQLFTSEQRLQDFNAQLARLNNTIKKSEFEAAQKEAEALNLAQCIDTFNTVSSKFNQDRITETEKIVKDLEKKAYKAEERTALFMQRLHAAERMLRDFEDAMRQMAQSGKAVQLTQ